MYAGMGVKIAVVTLAVILAIGLLGPTGARR